MTTLSPDELDNPLDSPSTPDDQDESPLASPNLPFNGASSPAQKAPPLAKMTTSSTPLGNLNAARKPPIAARGPNAEMLAKLNAFSISRNAPSPRPPTRTTSIPNSPLPQSPGPAVNGFPAGFRLPAGLQRSGGLSGGTPSGLGGGGVPGGMSSLAAKRGIALPGGLPPPAAAAPGPKRRPMMKLSDMNKPTEGAGDAGPAPVSTEPNKLKQYEKYIDAERGALTFEGKAVVHPGGIDFASGQSFKMSLAEVESIGELGKGNYGTVYKVRHSKPTFRQPGQGVAKAKSGDAASGPIMAMKEMRLELEDAKFSQIIMELDILHRCISPFIVDFYGAFFQEGAVYICMEWMDGGSVDKIYADGVPEGVLRKITYATVMGLKSLKEGHNIIHRDVKPTNILVNTRGQVKICDFGVSGNLVASIAKTNIGCQSYMAPERISGGGMSSAGADATTGTYSVQSDIWSLGLTIIEAALGHYPYPPETYENIFSQLSAIVDGDPPDLPADKFSEEARDFVAGCLNKIPNLRPTYPMLLQHIWLAPLVKPATITEEDEEEAENAEILPQAKTDGTNPNAIADHKEGFIDREVGEWVAKALERRSKGLLGKPVKPALHAAPLNATLSSPGPGVTSTAADRPIAV